MPAHMYVYVCACVYTYVYICICMYVCTYVRKSSIILCLSFSYYSFVVTQTKLH